MDIQLTDLIATMDPAAVVLVIGDQRYPANNLTVAEVLKLSTIEQAGDADALAFVASLFGDRVPPSVLELRASLDAGDTAGFGERQRLIKEVALIVSAVKLACAEVASPKKLTAAIESIQTSLATAAAPSTDSPA